MHTFIDLLMVFFARHWLVAITNAALTPLLGTGLVRLAGRWRVLRLSRTDLLRLQRLVLLCALSKGTLFLLLGVSFHRMRGFPLIFGIQVPDPRDILLLAPIGPNSVWCPTSASKLVSLFLVGGATLFLLRRGVQVIHYRQGLRALLHLGESTEGTNTVLRRAATALGLSSSQSLPTVVLAEVPYPTPMLVGLRRPYILLAPRLVQLLSEAELEMALRHELAHFRRHDHWWRWLFSWLEDVGRLNLLSGQLGVWALDLEEELCDRMAVRSPQEALVLASAIQKSVSFYRIDMPHIVGAGLTADEAEQPVSTSGAASPHGNASPRQPIAGATVKPNSVELPRSTAVLAQEDAVPHLTERVLPASVLPALLGRHTRKWSRPSALHQRLRCLLLAAQELSVQQAALSREPEAAVTAYGASFGASVLQKVALIIFGVLLFLVIYMKFYVVADVFGTKP